MGSSIFLVGIVIFFITIFIYCVKNFQDLKGYFAPNKEPITVAFDTVIDKINKGE